MDGKRSEFSTMNFAYSLFNKIPKVGYHQPDVVTFNTHLKGLCLNGDINSVNNLIASFFQKNFSDVEFFNLLTASSTACITIFFTCYHITSNQEKSEDQIQLLDGKVVTMVSLDLNHDALVLFF